LAPEVSRSARDQLEASGAASPRAVKVLGDETLRTIARELVATVRSNVTIDWTLRENVRERKHASAPEVLERIGGQLGVTHRVLNILVPQPSLQCASVVASVG
jgi:type I restriction enzyme, R subunit